VMRGIAEFIGMAVNWENGTYIWGVW